MRCLLLVIGLWVCLISTAQAREVWQGNGALSDSVFQRFLQLYKHDPSMLQTLSGALRNVSTKQLNQALSTLGVTHFTNLYPMILQGYDLPSVEGKKIAALSLMTPRGRGHQMIPIPFQIDEFDKDGLIWIQGKNDAEPDGTPGTFDDFDQLVFMFRDASTHRYNPATDGALTQGKILKEIRLNSPNGKPRWVYLVANSTQHFDTDYVDTNLKKGEVTSVFYSFQYQPDNLINIKRISPRIGPHAGQNVFSGMSVHMSTGILTRFTRINLDKDNIRITPLAVKDGPVRDVMLVHARIWYFGLPTFVDLQFMVYFYQQGITVPINIVMKNLKQLVFFLNFISDPKGAGQIVFKPVPGARVALETTFQKQQFTHANGKMDEHEKQMNRTRLIGDWGFLDSNRGWEVFFDNHIPLEPGGLFARFTKGMTLHATYEDSYYRTPDGKRQPVIKIGFAGQGLPHVATQLLDEVPDLDFDKIDSIGKLLFALKAAGDKGELDDISDTLNARLHELVKFGYLKSVPQLADLLLEDLKPFSFLGVDRQAFNKLIRDTIITTFKQPDQVDVAAGFDTFIRLAKKRGIDLHHLHYAFLYNPIWMVHWVGKGGPAGFAKQVKNPPTFTVKDYNGKDSVTKPQAVVKSAVAGVASQ